MSHHDVYTGYWLSSSTWPFLMDIYSAVPYNDPVQTLITMKRNKNGKKHLPFISSCQCAVHIPSTFIPSSPEKPVKCSSAPHSHLLQHHVYLTFFMVLWLLEHPRRASRSVYPSPVMNWSYILRSGFDDVHEGICIQAEAAPQARRLRSEEDVREGGV